MRQDIQLTDGFVLLRPYRADDTAELNNAVTESLRELKPWLDFATDDYSLTQSQQWVTECPRTWEAGTAYNFVITDASYGQYLGGCGINNFDSRRKIANLGYWVRTAQTRRGIATASTRLLVRWGIRELKLVRIDIQIAAPNRASQRVAEKAGATREGTLRNGMFVRDLMYDKVVYSIIPEDMEPWPID